MTITAFKKVLIANRGEIACRIIRTARRLGLTSVAVFSDADARARHVRLADESCHLGGSRPSESYLELEKIILAARESGSDAIHPGYGFLSENPEFAQMVRDEGLVFVGPSAESIRRMSLKDSAKLLMAEAGVPVVPGSPVSKQDAASLRAIADEIGYPVLIKPVAGGGGKGMRVVKGKSEFDQELRQARREAQSSFGSSGVFVEKYIENPRHLEVQVFGDQSGNMIHLFERDCSVQRRYQKIIEESPAPGLTEEFRQQLCNAAVKAARAVDYIGAGTVEFMARQTEGKLPDAFWFLEMNTRLQVEHPVTEAVTGFDLVEWQFRIAAGEELPCRQEDVGLNGHAIEARLYAEDVARGFLPAPGLLTRLQIAEGVRVDTGVGQGDRIPPFYDPMIAKVISHGENRREARRILDTALECTRLSGVSSNIPLLRAVLAQDRFVAGTFGTGWLEGEFLAGTNAGTPPDEAVAFAGLQLSGLGSGLSAESGFRLWDRACWDVLLACGPGSYRLTLTVCDRSSVNVEVGDQLFRLHHHPDNGWQSGNTGHRPFLCGCDGKAFVFLEGIWEFLPIASEAVRTGMGETGSDILSPMPGVVRRLMVSPGQVVRKGDRVAAIEAMKMEHMLRAPRDGQVGGVCVSEGDQVLEGELIVSLSDED